MKTGRAYRAYQIPKEVYERMHLHHIKGINFCGILFDIYEDRETGKKYLKVEGETGGSIVLVELTEGGELNGTPHDSET